MKQHIGNLAIGEAAIAAGCSVPTIRYYEQIGLLQNVGRTASSRRIYSKENVDRLRFIRRCRDFDLPISQVAQLINAVGVSADCNDALMVIVSHRDALRSRIRELKALERTLTQMEQRCAAQCQGGTADCCTIYDDLGASGPY